MGRVASFSCARCSTISLGSCSPKLWMDHSRSTTFSLVPRNKPNSTPGQLPIGSADLALPILRLFFYDSFCDISIPRIPHVIFIHLEVVPDIRIYPRPKLVFEGQELVLICSVNGVPGPITVSWYRKFKLKTDKKLHPSSKTEFKIPVVQNSHDGEYYCVASNSRSSFRSDPVTINVKGVSARYCLRDGFSNFVKTTRWLGGS